VTELFNESKEEIHIKHGLIVIFIFLPFVLSRFDMSLFLSPYGYVEEEDDLCTYEYTDNDPVESDTDKENGKTVVYYPLGSDVWLSYFFAVCFLFARITESLQMWSNGWNYILDLVFRLFRRNEPGVFFPNWARVSTVTTTESNGHHHSIYRYCHVLNNQLTENYVYLNPDRITVREVMAQHPSLMMMDRGLLTIRLREMRYLRVIPSVNNNVTENDIEEIETKEDDKENYINVDYVTENDNADDNVTDDKNGDNNVTENMEDETAPIKSSVSFLAVEYRHTATMKSLRTYSMHIPVEEMYVGNHILSKEYIASYFEHKNWWSRPPFAMEISPDDGEEEYTIYVMDSHLAVAHLGPQQYLEIEKEGYKICPR
jgi:hypothetical protein